MAHNAQDILDTILSRLKALAATDTVIGEPVKLDGVTILPVIKVSFGFAAGGGEGGSGGEKAATGMGGGGGGGALITPVGFIIHESDAVRFVSISKGGIETLVESIPEILKKFGIGGKKGDPAPAPAG